MQGASPLASPGAEPGRHGLLLWKVSSGGGLRPLRGGVRGGIAVPGGGRRGVVACRPCLAGTRRGAQGGVACLPFALALFLPPSPRPPSRREGGDSKFISPGATAPGTPAIGWEAALDLLLENGTFSLSGKKFSTEGKDSNAARDAAAIGNYPRRFSKCRTGSGSGDARGEAPCIK